MRRRSATREIPCRDQRGFAATRHAPELAHTPAIVELVRKIGAEVL
jgi:hypothetical protein